MINTPPMVLDRGDMMADGVLSDDAGQYISSRRGGENHVTGSSGSVRKNILVNKSLGVVIPPQVMRTGGVDQVAQ